jgi:CO dehydrogenase nickel-insertion accessory protein CooC1
VVGNKVRHEADETAIRDHLQDLPLVGWLPYSDQAVEADLQNKALYDLAPDLVDRTRKIVSAVLAEDS